MIHNSPDYLRAVAYLETLQRYFYERDPIAKRFADAARQSDNDDDLRRFAQLAYEGYMPYFPGEISFDQFFEMWKRSWIDPPTRYEHRISYSIIYRLAERIESAAAALRLNPAKTPIFGTIPTGRLNGIAAPVDNARYYVIILDRGVFAIANIFSSLIGQFISPVNAMRSSGRGVDTNKVSLAIRPEHEDLLFELVTNYVIAGEPHLTPKKPGSIGHEPISSAMLAGMELFIVGHEYAHCAKGHLDRGKIIRRAFPGRIAIDEVCPDWKDEYEADFYGWLLTERVFDVDGTSTLLRSVGAESVFYVIEMLDKARSVLLYGEERESESCSHPPAKQRIERLRSAMFNEFGRRGAAHAEIQRMCQLADAVRWFIDTSYSRFRAELVRMHNEGVEVYERL